MSSEQLAEARQRTTRWWCELAEAELCAGRAGEVIRAEFGRRDIVVYKGLHDVLLRTDLRAQEQIVDHLNGRFPLHHVVAEEGLQGDWSEREYTWVVDPLDGTNNFGYGIAHCAVAICLFQRERAVLALVFDPIVDRWFVATDDLPLESRPAADVPLRQATISLVSGYSQAARRVAGSVGDLLSERCKRVCSLWAPALDLALVANGQVNAMVCVGASFLDVCAGMFLVRSAGGTILGSDGSPLEVERSLHARPISFVAARSTVLAHQLVAQIGCLLEGWQRP